MAMIYRITSNVQEVLRAAAEQKTRAISEERLTQAGHYSIFDRYESLHMCD